MINDYFPQVNLGVYDENLASTQGVINFLRHLKKYVPENGSYPVLVNGDQLSVERTVSARLCMASSSEKRDRFIDMEPTPQDFHMRCHLLQVLTLDKSM